jgi:hypothetical protein
LTAALVWLGFVLGLRHAIEPDHLTAVAALSSRGVQARAVARIAGAWGLGHATVLFATGVALVWTGARWPPAVAAALELAAGLMLVWLGADVLRRTAVARPVAAAPPAFAARAFLVGGVHGIEGSGAVVLLALPSVRSTGAAAVYLGAFGLGSVAGMIACSFAVTLPLGLAARRLARRARQLQLVVGVSSIAVGAAMVAGYIRSIFT